MSTAEKTSVEAGAGRGRRRCRRRRRRWARASPATRRSTTRRRAAAQDAPAGGKRGLGLPRRFRKKSPARRRGSSRGAAAPTTAGAVRITASTTAPTSTRRGGPDLAGFLERHVPRGRRSAGSTWTAERPRRIRAVAEKYGCTPSRSRTSCTSAEAKVQAYARARNTRRALRDRRMMELHEASSRPSR